MSLTYSKKATGQGQILGEHHYFGFVWNVRSDLGARLHKFIQIRVEPVFNNSTTTIVIKFVKQNVMMDSIKSFLEVSEDSTREKTLIHISLYCVYNV